MKINILARLRWFMLPAFGGPTVPAISAVPAGPLAQGRSAARSGDASRLPALRVAGVLAPAGVYAGNGCGGRGITDAGATMDARFVGGDPPRGRPA